MSLGESTYIFGHKGVKVFLKIQMREAIYPDQGMGLFYSEINNVVNSVGGRIEWWCKYQIVVVKLNFKLDRSINLISTKSLTN